MSTAIKDGMGRAAQSRLDSDPGGVPFVNTTYDAFGRKKTISNPYRSTREPTFGITTFEYDALGRVTKVIPPDGSTSANNLTTTYSGNCATLTDQAGKQRKTCTDALGRLTNAYEPDSGGSFIYQTVDTYDALDNLTQVQQKGNDSNSANWRTRAFSYNSLSQLTSATNPESGTTTYGYDSEGTLTSRVAPKPNQTNPSVTVTTTYVPDELHRVTKKMYSDGTPLVKYLYDGSTPVANSECSVTVSLTVSNGIGRRTGMCDAAGGQAWSFDPLGRVAAARRTTSGVTKDISYSYTLEGSPAEVRYPSGLRVGYAYNSAAQAISAADNYLVRYAWNATYAPQGALASALYGQRLPDFNGIAATYTYNNRLQPASLQASSANGTVLDLTYNFNVGTGR